MTAGQPYPITIAFDVQWGDMDAFGHVNNARYFTWFESCRSVYFVRMGLRMDRPSALGPIVANLTCDYLAPVVYPANLIPESYTLPGGVTIWPQWIYALNPMVGVIEGFRAALLGTRPMPLGWIALGTVTAILLTVSGALYFRNREKLFADVA